MKKTEKKTGIWNKHKQNESKKIIEMEQKQMKKEIQ